nr:uncharacterized protein LOC124814256 [Hydra vulgaris]
MSRFHGQLDQLFCNSSFNIFVFLDIRRNLGLGTIRTLICCPNKVSTYTPNCPEAQENSCIISTLKAPWEYGKYRVCSIQCVLRKEVEDLIMKYKKLQSLKNRLTPGTIKDRDIFLIESKKVFWLEHDIKIMIDE